MGTKLAVQYLCDITNETITCINAHREIVKIKKINSEFDDSVYKAMTKKHIRHIESIYNILRQNGFYHSDMAFVGSFLALVQNHRRKEVKESTVSMDI